MLRNTNCGIFVLLHDMFGKEVYIARRKALMERLAGEKGVALFLALFVYVLRNDIIRFII